MSLYRDSAFDSDDVEMFVPLTQSSPAIAPGCILHEASETVIGVCGTQDPLVLAMSQNQLGRHILREGLSGG